MASGIRFIVKDTNIGIFKCSEHLRIDTKYKIINEELQTPPLDIFNENTICCFTLNGYRNFKLILKEYYNLNKQHIDVIRIHIKKEAIVYKDNFQYVINQ